MLTGGLPFNGESAREVIFAKLEGEYPMALVRNPQVPGPLEAVLARLLKPHPDERYQSASDLIEALEVLRLSSDTPTFVRLDEGDPSTIPTAPRKEKRWYAEFRASDGTWQRQRMTSAQVRAALDDEAFVRTARVGRHPDALRPVEEHSEFQLPLSERPSDEERGPAAGRGTFLIGLALAAATAALGLCLYRVLA
jgi:hypothetical protein